GERVDGAGRGGTATGDGDRASGGEQLEHGTGPLVERRDIQAEWAGFVDAGDDRVAGLVERGRVHHPVARGRRAPLAGQPFELVDVDPAPFGDDPLDGAVGP